MRKVKKPTKVSKPKPAAKPQGVKNPALQKADPNAGRISGLLPQLKKERK